MVSSWQWHAFASLTPWGKGIHPWPVDSPQKGAAKRSSCFLLHQQAIEQTVDLPGISVAHIWHSNDSGNALYVPNPSPSLIHLWPNKVSLNERSRYICKTFSHWLRRILNSPYSVDIAERNGGKFRIAIKCYLQRNWDGKRSVVHEKDNDLKHGCSWKKMTGKVVLRWGLLSRFPPFRYFPHFSTSPKYMLAIEYHVHIWQASPRLSCRDTCQIWMRFKEYNRYFCQIENFAYEEIDERSFSNPTPGCCHTETWNNI